MLLTSGGLATKHVELIDALFLTNYIQILNFLWKLYLYRLKWGLRSCRHYLVTIIISNPIQVELWEICLWFIHGFVSSYVPFYSYLVWTCTNDRIWDMCIASLWLTICTPMPTHFFDINIICMVTNNVHKIKFLCSVQLSLCYQVLHLKSHFPQFLCFCCICCFIIHIWCG